jgi:hypothetical protein
MHATKHPEIKASKIDLILSKEYSDEIKSTIGKINNESFKSISSAA